MGFTSAEATEIMQALVAASNTCLDHLKIPREPQGKWKAWKVQGGPIGMGYHYTNGPNGVKSIKWFNHPGWGNKGSSCHAMVFDRVIQELEELWPKQAVAQLFKVPTLIHFDVSKAAWHINWSNDRLFGVENRNTGYSGYKRLSNGLTALGKVGVVVKDRIYEEYWREQIECNILLGRLWTAIRGELFDPAWVCGHSQIWASKLDPGPLFPTMHEMRSAIFSSEPLSSIGWLARYEPALPAMPVDDGGAVTGDSREDPPETEDSWDPQPIVTPVPDANDLPLVSQMLGQLGWPTTPELLDPQDLKRFIAYFQRSTLAWKYNKHPERVLKVDGIAGPKTIAALKDQLKRLRLA